MPEPTPSPSLDEFLAMRAADPNAWWRLDSGDHLNLFEEALDELERLETGTQEIVDSRLDSEVNTATATLQEELEQARARIAELEGVTNGHRRQGGGR